MHAVVVVGNGPVGQTAALLLARWDIPVVLLEQRMAREVVGSKSICQQRDVLDVWAAAGVPEIAAEGLTWTTARTFYRDRELFAWSFVDPGSSPLPPFVNISQSRTEQLLDQRIAAEPLIEVRWAYDVIRIDQDSDAVTLTCATDAGEVAVQASYVITATGGHCVLRDQLGVRFEGESFDDRFLICDIRADLPGWERERRFYFDPEWNPGRQVLIHPCPDSTYRIDWQVPAGYDLAEEERTGALDARIRKVIGDRQYEIVWRSVYRFQARLVDRMRVGRVLLAGDCAHLLAPFGARGLNSGVLDAENAAWKLAFVLRGWAPETLLDSYHDERHAAAVENLDVTSATMRFLVPHGEAAVRERHRVLEAAMTDPDARSRVDSGRLAEPFWYVDSPLTTADPTRPFGGRPARGQSPAVCPGVLVPDAPIHDPDRRTVTRLREIVRDGVLAITTSGQDVSPALKNAIDAPSRVVRLETIDDSGALSAALGARTGEVWLIRPDGHVAAVLADPDPATIAAVGRRMLGL